MSPLHVAAALLIVAMWGLNFTVIRFGLDEFTPFTFATWRFVLGALPILFVPKPAISWGTLAGIGGFMFTGQFVFLFFAMEAGLPPLPLGIAALVIDGPTALLSPLLAPTWRGWFVLFYTVVPAMWLGYLIWGTLLRTYPAAKIGPVSLLVPCAALTFAALLVGEPVGGVRLLGIIVVLGGVATGVYASARRMR